MQTRGGYREWSDRIPTGAIPERSEGRSRRRVDDVSRRDLETSSLASWSRALDDQRRELLAGVGHELKTPLSIVLGLCGRLLAAAELGDGHDRGRPAHPRQRLRPAQARRGAAAGLAPGRRPPRARAARRRRRPASCARASRASPASPSCATSASCSRRPPRLPARVDEEKVLSVVSNLLANALKYAPAGGTVRCTVAERRRAAAHRGGRQRPGRGRRAARDDLRALPPRRGQRRAPGWHRPRAWRSCATSWRCTTAWSRSPTRPRAEPSSWSTCRSTSTAADDGERAASAADDRRRRAPARDGRAAARRARRRRAPRRPRRREPSRAPTARASSSSPRDAELGAYVGRAHRPPLRRSSTRPTRWRPRA